MASPPINELGRQILRLQAQHAFGGEPVEFLAFLQQLFSDGVIAEFDHPGSIACQVLHLALQEFPDSVVVTISRQLAWSHFSITRYRCANLLLHLFHPGQNLYSRLSAAALKEFKMIILRHIDRERFLFAYQSLFRLTSYLMQLFVPKRQWPEAYDYLFESLKSYDPSKKERASHLFERLIPRCPDLFLVRVDELNNALKGFMGGAFQDMPVSAAAVGAAVQFILHLTTPSTHRKYNDLVQYILWVLYRASRKAVTYIVAETTLRKIITLVEREPGFLKPPIDYFVECLLRMAETFFSMKNVAGELAVEVITILAEDKEYGCALIQNVAPSLLERLFTALMYRLAVTDNNEDGDGEADEAAWRNCRLAKQSVNRLAVALGDDVVVRSLPGALPEFLGDTKSSRSYAAITFLGLIADSGLRVSLGISDTLAAYMLTLWNDSKPRVRWATIKTVGQFSKNWGPHFQQELFEFFLPALLDVVEDYDNPSLQKVAASTLVLLSVNCSSDVFRPHLQSIFDKVHIFQQRADHALKEAALTSLAYLAESFQEEFKEQYGVLLCCLNDELATLLDESHWLTTARTIDCMTRIGLAIGKEKFMNSAEKIIEVLKYFQEHATGSGSSVRCCLLKAWGRLCKCLGTGFVPYLTTSLPQLLRSANINPSSNNNAERSQFLDEKATACDMLCCFGEEFTAEIHPWINEILGTFLPLLTFESDDRVRTTAISAMPLMLHSASLAMQKGLNLHRPVEESGEEVILALKDALCEKSEISICVKILEALGESVQISGLCLGESTLNQLINRIAEVLLVCSHIKTERKKRVEEGLDRREKRMLREEIEADNKIYKAVADCLSGVFKICKADILPIFDKLLLPRLALMDVKNSTAERTMLLRICHDVAEHCGQDAFKQYKERLLSMLQACDLQNPDVWEIVAHGISICAEFGGTLFKPHLEVALSTLQCILGNPKGLDPDRVVAYEIAVVALGKICQFHFHGPSGYKVVDIWLDYLPLRNNLDEAKLVHDDLCTMIEKFENKVLGLHPRYDDFRRIIEIFSEVMWAGNNLATDDTLNRMKKILRRFKRRLLPSVFESICSSFPFPLQTMLKSYLTDSCADEVATWRKF